MTPKFLGALTRWLLKGCKTNFFKEEWIGDKENKNLIIGYIAARGCKLNCVSKEKK